MVVAIALRATSMSDSAVLGHLAPVLGAAPSGPTIRRVLEQAGGTTALEKTAACGPAHARPERDWNTRSTA
jgi:hypothetical protein